MKLRKGLWYAGMYGRLCSTIKNSDLVRRLLKARMWRSHMGPSSPNPSLVKHSLLLVIAPATRCALFPDCASDAPWRDPLEKKKTDSDQHNEMYYVKSKRRYPKMNAPYPDVRQGKIEVGNESKTFHFKIWSRWKDLTAFTEARPMFLGCQRTVSQPLREDQKLLGVQVLQKPSRYKIWQINREGEVLGFWCYSLNRQSLFFYSLTFQDGVSEFLIPCWKCIFKVRVFVKPLERTRTLNHGKTANFSLSALHYYFKQALGAD